MKYFKKKESAFSGFFFFIFYWFNSFAISINATVISTGDLQWQPEPFVFHVKKGEEVRYIDYENGNDENDGKTKDTPWKHHPWDSRAT